MERQNNYLIELMLILISVIIAVVTIPILCGINIGFFLNLTGFLFFGGIILTSILIWSILYVLWWV